jgi:hypothetical protein
MVSIQYGAAVGISEQRFGIATPPQGHHFQLLHILDANLFVWLQPIDADQFDVVSAPPHDSTYCRPSVLVNNHYLDTYPLEERALSSDWGDGVEGWKEVLVMLMAWYCRNY